MSAELNKAHTHHTELQSCRKDPGFTFCLTEIEVLMCSFVANKCSDSVAQETKSFPGLQLITDRWRLFMLLCCWMCGLGTTVLPAVLCSYRHQGCLFLFEIIISGGSWRPVSTKPSTFVHRTVHFSLQLIPTSQHLLCSSEPSLVPQQLWITSGVSASQTAMRFLITSSSCHMLRVTHQALLAHIFW